MGNVAQTHDGAEGVMVVENDAANALRAIATTLEADLMLGWLPDDVTASLKDAQSALARMFPKPTDANGSLPF